MFLRCLASQSQYSKNGYGLISKAAEFRLREASLLLFLVTRGSRKGHVFGRFHDKFRISTLEESTVKLASFFFNLMFFFFTQGQGTYEIKNSFKLNPGTPTKKFYFAFIKSSLRTEVRRKCHRRYSKNKSFSFSVISVR